MKNSEKTLDMIVNLCKSRGFVYAGSEIYGGLANSWDYGPLGVEFKNNVKKAWLKKFVQESDYNVGLDAAILMNPQTWITTGHVGSFSDPLVDCKGCGSRERADKLIEAAESGKGVNVDAMSFDEMDAFIAAHDDVVCPQCGKHNFTAIRKFNLMFKTQIGVTEDTA
ncbi:MAG: glycine--tRNA ligase, partial [Faecousia sp.]